MTNGLSSHGQAWSQGVGRCPAVVGGRSFQFEPRLTLAFGMRNLVIRSRTPRVRLGALAASRYRPVSQGCLRQAAVRCGRKGRYRSGAPCRQGQRATESPGRKFTRGRLDRPGQGADPTWAGRLAEVRSMRGVPGHWFLRRRSTALSCVNCGLTTGHASRGESLRQIAQPSETGGAAAGGGFCFRPKASDRRKRLAAAVDGGGGVCARRTGARSVLVRPRHAVAHAALIGDIARVGGGAS